MSVSKSSSSDQGAAGNKAEREGKITRLDDDDHDGGNPNDSVETPDDKPKHVSSALWQRFKALEKRTDEVTKRSTEKRINHLKKKISETVREHLDINSSGIRVSEERQCLKIKSTCSNKDEPKGKESVEDQWKDVRKYVDIYKHLDNKASTGQSHLEKQIDERLERGDYSTACRLSDQLANREFGTKIAQAFDARDFTKRKKEMEAENQSKKKKKLNWGFEAKERWETKSNM